MKKIIYEIPEKASEETTNKIWESIFTMIDFHEDNEKCEDEMEKGEIEKYVKALVDLKEDMPLEK